MAFANGFLGSLAIPDSWGRPVDKNSEDDRDERMLHFATIAEHLPTFYSHPDASTGLVEKQ